MYPAGRILHLVPARLVFTAEQLAKLGKRCMSNLPCPHACMQDKHRVCLGLPSLGVCRAVGCGKGVLAHSK